MLPAAPVHPVWHARVMADLEQENNADFEMHKREFTEFLDQEVQIDVTLTAAYSSENLCAHRMARESTYRRFAT